MSATITRATVTLHKALFFGRKVTVFPPKPLPKLPVNNYISELSENIPFTEAVRKWNKLPISEKEKYAQPSAEKKAQYKKAYDEFKSKFTVEQYAACHLLGALLHLYDIPNKDKILDIYNTITPSIFGIDVINVITPQFVRHHEHYTTEELEAKFGVPLEKNLSPENRIKAMHAIWYEHLTETERKKFIEDTGYRALREKSREFKRNVVAIRAALVKEARVKTMEDFNTARQEAYEKFTNGRNEARAFRNQQKVDAGQDERDESWAERKRKLAAERKAIRKLATESKTD